ncbi:hypothetical protein IHE44_0014953 [Lamprotornis superbus]|uniref:Selenoprotein F n=1 Tax=Lamprotornis superbus TaxID=245042 RepID=A0A835TZV0_9PASS|nr:hypothetical protein IHE44_0014953 [Lamprotornis superbus]
MTTFVRSDKPKLFRGLQIKYVRGSDPVLKLLDDSGNIAEELSILKWNTDRLQYLAKVQTKDAFLKMDHDPKDATHFKAQDDVSQIFQSSTFTDQQRYEYVSISQ